MGPEAHMLYGSDVVPHGGLWACFGACGGVRARLKRVSGLQCGDGAIVSVLILDG